MTQQILHNTLHYCCKKIYNMSGSPFWLNSRMQNLTLVEQFHILTYIDFNIGIYLFKTFDSNWWFFSFSLTFGFASITYLYFCCLRCNFVSPIQCYARNQTHIASSTYEFVYVACMYWLAESSIQEFHGMIIHSRTLMITKTETRFGATAQTVLLDHKNQEKKRKKVNNQTYMLFALRRRNVGLIQKCRPTCKIYLNLNLPLQAS